MLDKVLDIMERIPLIGKYSVDIRLMCMMLQDYFKKEYKAIPMRTIT